MSLIARFFGPTSPGARPRLHLQDQPAVVYAIGDIHGHLGLLRDLEAQVMADAATIEGEKWLVTLGDYIDRGPDSAGVLEDLMAPPPPGFTRFALTGNHEQAMLDFCDGLPSGDNWLRYGGIQTLQSYGIDIAGRGVETLRAEMKTAVPPEHFAFMRALPVLLETPGQIFVHAGLRPSVPLSDQVDSDLLWIRDNYAGTYAEFGKTVVHGHTPIERALVTASRVGIDTGAYASGLLTAIRFMPGQPPLLFHAGGEPTA